VRKEGIPQLEVIRKEAASENALKAGFWYVISTILVKAVSILTTPLFSRIMTIQEYGLGATFISWYSLLLPFCSLNLAYSIGRAKLDYPTKLDTYIGSMEILSFLFSSLFVGTSFFFIKPLSNMMGLPNTALLLLGLYLLFSPAILFVQNGYRYQYKYKENICIAWYIFIFSVLLSLVMMLFLDGNKAIYRMTGLTVPSVILSCLILYKTGKSGQLKDVRTYWKYGLRLSVPLLLHTVSLNILSQSDQIFIMKLSGASDAGIYNLAYRYGLMLSIVTIAVGDGWLPWFHDSYYGKHYDAIRNNVKWVVVLGCFVGLLSVTLAPEAIWVLGGAKYLNGIYCVPPIVLGILCQYIYTHYVNIELHLKKVKYVSMGTILAASVNLILNAVFIPIYGFIAAAYTTLFSYLLLLIIHFAVTRFLLKVKLYHDSFMFGAFAVSVIISLVIIRLYPYPTYRYIIFSIEVIVFLVLLRIVMKKAGTKAHI
jgi:O-antigen/teichoic acid export membrane protein